MNIDKLREYAKNKELLSYKELCEIMNWKYLTGGNGKKKQFEELANVCKYHQEGRKYMIDEFCNTISQNNLSQIDADIDMVNTFMPLQKCIISKYLFPNIEYLILYNLSHQQADKVYVTTKELLNMCGMINRNYYDVLASDIKKSTQEIAEAYDMNYDNLIVYTDNVYRILSPMIVNALSSMSKKYEIIYSDAYKCLKNNQIVNCVNPDDKGLGYELFLIQGEVLSSWGIKVDGKVYNKIDLVLNSNLYRRFNYECNVIAKEKSKNDKRWIENNWDIDSFFKCNCLVLNNSKILTDYEITSTEKTVKQAIKQIRDNLIEKTGIKITETKVLQGINKQTKLTFIELYNNPEGDNKYSVKEFLQYSNKSISPIKLKIGTLPQNLAKNMPLKPHG